MAAPARRRLLLGSALALTVGVSAWMAGQEAGPGDDEAAPAGAAERPAGRRQAGRTGSVPDLRLQRGSGEGGEIRDLFAVQSWFAPPQEATAAGQPAAAPQMPALPFTYFGKLVDGGRVTVYLATAERNLAVRRGDVIDGTWRVDAIRPGAMVLRYLPLGRTQTLEIGRAR